MKRYLQWLIYYVIIALPILARAGGAGGRSSSSSSSRSYSSSSSSSGGGDVPPIIVVIVIAGGIIYEMIKSSNRKEELNKVEKMSEESKERFFERNPNFNEEKFIEKAKDTFLKVQYAWEKKDLKSVRNYISDGVYQRFNSQIMMMNELGQKNTILDLKIIKANNLAYEVDGEFDIIYVAFTASIKDSFVCELDRNFNRKANEVFNEYWAFIRRKNRDNEEFEVDSRCPSCGGDLGNIEDIEIAQCPYCHSVINSGEFDWVLSEIYQSKEEVLKNMENYENLLSVKGELLNKDKNFSKQFLEDKACNGLVQYDKAMALFKPELVRRFVTNEVYENLNQRLGDIVKGPYLYNTYYFHWSRLIYIKEEENRYIAKVEVKKTTEKVRKKDGKKGIVRVSKELMNRTNIITLTKEINDIRENLYVNKCPNCGGILEDTIDTHCPYCKELITDPKYDWVITDIS